MQTVGKKFHLSDEFIRRWRSAIEKRRVFRQREGREKRWTREEGRSGKWRDEISAGRNFYSTEVSRMEIVPFMEHLNGLPFVNC